uniref:SMI1/KNR4 family protein n=1 Tax=Roseihalotalea indica TaxID=2867963 RepID=A0AA49GHZ0_9BACT|nr:SMI1/KNR4 family protein [Tunicatimonas sp. TK19036]
MKDSDCKVKQPNFGIQLPKHVPDDLKQFYDLTDGILLFGKESYSIEIIGRQEFKPINQIFFSEDERKDIGDDISNNWFLIGKDDSLGQYISIDLSEARNGQCYDSFHETHGLAGDSPIIAKTFSDMLVQLYQNKGLYWYWLEDGFKKLGDAYDEN